MNGLALVLLSHQWLPLASADDLAHRYEVASAIEAVTRDEGERRLLMRIARFEGAYDPRVTRCERKGDNGRAVTQWQLHVFGSTRELVCRDMVEAARHALWMARASIAECKHLPRRERLAVFASGSCARGHAASRLRWAE